VKERSPARRVRTAQARDPAIYRATGRRVAPMRRGASLSSLAEELVLILREHPPHGRLMNALEHLWGHVSTIATAEERKNARRSGAGLLLETRALAVRSNERHLMASTALSELATFLRCREAYDSGH
jgi:uncharacterized protein DUF1722